MKISHVRIMILAMMLISNKVHGVVVEIAPTVDGHAIDSNPADGTFDTLDLTNTELSIRNFDGSIPFGGPFSEERQAALEFDLSSVPMGSSVTSATLTISGRIALSSPISVNLIGYAGNGAINLADFPLISDTVGALTFSGVGFSSYVSDVTSSVQQRIANGGTYAGFGFRASTVTPSTFVVGHIQSLEGTTPASLEIEFMPTAVPEPNSFLFGLLVCGLVGLRTNIKRRRTVRGSGKSGLNFQ